MLCIFVLFCLPCGMLSNGKNGALRGKGGVPGVHIMENEFECLAGRGDRHGHFAAEFVKKYCS